MAVLQSGQRNGVVEVAGVGRIDRDDRLAGQVESALGDRFVEGLGLLASVFQDVLGKLFRQVELANDRERVDARLAGRSQDFGDYAFTFVDGRREADHLEDDLVAGPCVLGARITQADRLGE